MDTIELARKALKTIRTKSFNCWVYGGDWDDYREISLTPEETLYLIQSEIGYSDVFDGFKLEEIDVESLALSIAKEGAWPDGGPEARVNNIIPSELEEISDALDSLDENDEAAVRQMRERLSGIEEGDYTFIFTVVDGSYSYYFTEDAEEEIHLTAKEALGLLMNENDIPAVFDGICSEALDEDFINEKAEAKGFAEDYDNLNYGARYEALERYVSSWGTLVNKILDGSVNEDSLDLWLKYFDDSDDFETDIEEWAEDNSE